MNRRRHIMIPTVLGGAKDTVRPTVAITSTESSPTLAVTIPLTITFSESVTGFEVGDITVAGCTLGSLSGSGAVYTVTATPTAASITVDIAAGVAADGAGNTNTAATQFAITATSYQLQAWWKLDEVSNGSAPITRNDSRGANHLTDSNNTASGTGKISNGADFEATSTQWLSIADNAALSTGDIDFTLACWVKLESVGANRTVVAKVGGSSATDEYSVYYDHAAGRFKFYTGGTAYKIVTANNLGAPNLDTWYFIVAWHDAAGDTVNIQINNGTADSLATSNVGPNNSTSAFSLGVYKPSAPQDYFDGVIDEVAMWKRVLSAAEKTWLYNSGTGRTF